MRILITGGCGYIGSHVTRALLIAGHQIVVYDDLSRGRRMAAGAADLVVADVNDAGALERVMRSWRFDMVVHLAALIDPAESMEQALDYYNVNACGTMCVLEHCLRHSVGHFIFSSTAAVYAPGNPIPIREDARLSPVSVYGQSKWMAERMIADCAKQADMKYVIFRYYNVAGAAEDGQLGELPDSKHIIPRANEAAARGGEVTIYGTDYETHDGTCVRDYVHVLDLAEVHCAAADYLCDGGSSDIFNVGSQRGYSVLEVVGQAARIAPHDLKVRYGERRKADPPCLVADAARIKRSLGWQPERDDLADMIATDAKWRQGEVYQDLLKEYRSENADAENTG